MPRELTPEELALIAGDPRIAAAAEESGGGEPIVVTGSPPPPPPIVITGSPPPPPSGGGGGGGTGSPPPPPPPCQPAPNRSNAATDPALQSALTTGNADQAGVGRVVDNWDIIKNAANAHGIDPALLGAIALRETNFRNIPQTGGGQGRGVFQIDLGAHPNVTEAQAYDIPWAANYAANILASNASTIRSQHPGFTPAQNLQATAASYNFGTGNISGNPNTIDVGTTGNNYGSNVANMMKAFKIPGTDYTPGAASGVPGHQPGC